MTIDSGSSSPILLQRVIPAFDGKTLIFRQGRRKRECLLGRCHCPGLVSQKEPCLSQRCMSQRKAGLDGQAFLQELAGCQVLEDAQALQSFGIQASRLWIERQHCPPVYVSLRWYRRTEFDPHLFCSAGEE